MAKTKKKRTRRGGPHRATPKRPKTTYPNKKGRYQKPRGKGHQVDLALDRSRKAKKVRPKYQPTYRGDAKGKRI